MNDGNGWKSIPGWEGLYSASKDGKIRRDPGSPSCRNGRILKPVFHHSAATDYMRVGLWRDGAVKREFVHRLVMLTFAGPCPKGNVVCHRDGNSFDNRLDNLKYDTQAANIRFNIWLQTQQKESEWDAAQPEAAAALPCN